MRYLRDMTKGCWLVVRIDPEPRRREFLALEKLKGGSSPGAHEGDLVPVAALVDGLDGVAPAYDGDSRALRDRLGDGKGTLAGALDLKNSHGAVPQNGSGIDDFLRVDIRGLGVLCPPLPSHPRYPPPTILTSPRVLEPKSRESVTSVSMGKRKRTPLASGLGEGRLGQATLSGSDRLSPTVLPLARAKVYAMAPPMMMTSALSISLSMTVILSLTLAPPRITTKGRSGLSVFPPRNSSSLSMR